MARLRDAYSTQSSASDLARSVQEWLERSDPTVLFRTCLTCHYCDTSTAVCKRFKRVPPVATITGRDACSFYADDEDIPF